MFLKMFHILWLFYHIYTISLDFYFFSPLYVVYLCKGVRLVATPTTVRLM